MCGETELVLRVVSPGYKGISAQTRCCLPLNVGDETERYMNIEQKARGDSLVWWDLVEDAKNLSILAYFALQNSSHNQLLTLSILLVLNLHRNRIAYTI